MLFRLILNNDKGVTNGKGQQYLKVGIMTSNTRIQ